jgi:hypothetical protein
MDKKDKLLIMLAPVALIVGAYVLFGDQLLPAEAGPSALTDESFTSIEAPVTEGRKKRTEIYRDKFFGKEVKVDSAEGLGEMASEEERRWMAMASESEERLKQMAMANDGEEGRRQKASDSEEGRRRMAMAKANDSEILISDGEKGRRRMAMAMARDSAREMSDGEINGRPVEEKVAKRRAGFVSGTGAVANGSADEAGPGMKENETGEVIVPVVIQEAVEAKAGSNIQLRTLEEVVINDVVIAKHTLVTGVVSFQDERVMVVVSNVKGTTRNVPVKMRGYDIDGNAGMPVEGGVNKEIKKDVVGDAIAQTGRVVRIPILNNLPISASNKKVNDPVVPIPKGYKLFLKQEKR